MATKPASPALQGGNSLATGLNLYLLLADGSGTNATDYSGNGNAGTLGGGATWTTDAAGNAVSCTGGGYVSVPLPAVASGDDFTLMFMHQPTTWPSGFTVTNDDTSRVWSLFWDTSGNLSFNGTMTAHVTAGGAMSAGSLWQFLMKRASGTTTWFVNGTQIQTLGSDTASASATTVRFGQNQSGGGASYNGLFDTIAFWTRALSGAEISGLVTDPYAVVRPAGGGVGSVSVTATVAGAGSSLARSVGNADGLASVAGVGASISKAAGNSDGTVTVSGVGAALAKAVGNADGTATVAGIGAALAKGVGNTDGVAAVAGVGASSALGSGVGAAVGAATVAGIGRSLAAASGTADGAVSASGVGSALAAGVGTVGAGASSLGAMVALALGTGTANGRCSVDGVGDTGVSPQITISGTGTAAGTCSVIGIAAVREAPRVFGTARTSNRIAAAARTSNWTDTTVRDF